jgi:hypothetical protein
MRRGIARVTIAGAVAAGLVRCSSFGGGTTPAPDDGGGEAAGRDGSSVDSSSNPDAADGQSSKDASSDACGSQKHVFVSDGQFSPGNKNGVNVADTICKGDAMEAGLCGSYVAWLSTTSTPAIARLTHTGAYYRTDGKPVFANRAALVSAKLDNPVTLTAAARVVDPAIGVVTGTLANGTAGENCTNWMVTTGIAVGGLAGGNAASWTEGQSIPCSGAAPYLYCFEE